MRFNKIGMLIVGVLWIFMGIYQKNNSLMTAGYVLAGFALCFENRKD